MYINWGFEYSPLREDERDLYRSGIPGTGVASSKRVDVMNLALSVPSEILIVSSMSGLVINDVD